MILASATTHFFEEHITGFRSIDSKYPSRSITRLEKAIKVLEELEKTEDKDKKI